jgi:hypothetical protein
MIFANRGLAHRCGVRQSNAPRRWRLPDQRVGHRLPRFFVLADAQPIAGANQRQVQQLRLPFDAGHNVGVRQAEILKPGIDIRFPFCVQEGGQTEALGEPADLRRRYRPLVQIYHLDGNTPFFEESLSRACFVGFLDSENLDVQALFPPSVALLHRKDSHERFHSVDFAVVDLKRFPHRELVAAALAHAPGHAQPDDAHALIDGDDARLHVTEAIEDRERLCRDVLAAGGELAVGTCHQPQMARPHRRKSWRR